jgi:hypothetical protein
MTRGIRNNNPGNIENVPGVIWQGTDETRSDPRFVVFKEPKWGIRAIARVLITYQDKRRAKDGSRIDTIQEIIERWAPAPENDTASYVSHVSKLLEIGSTDTIDVYDYETMKRLVKAIILHENGQQPYTDAQIDAGLVLAGIEPPVRDLGKTRTVRGGKIGIGATGAVVAAEVLEDLRVVQDQLVQIMPYLEIAKYAFLAVTLIGFGVMLWARLDDRRKGLR